MTNNIYRITMEYTKKYRTPIIWIILCATVVNIFSLVYSYTYKYVIDSVIQKDSVVYWLLLMLGILIVNTFMTYWIYSYYLAVFKIRIANDLRLNTFKSIMMRPYPFFRKNDSGSILVKLLDDPRQMSDYIALYHFIYIGNSLRFVITFSFLFSLNSLLSVVILLSIPVYYFTVRFSFKKLNRSNEEERTAFDRLSYEIKDSIDGIKSIKAGEHESFFSKRMGRILQEWFVTERRIMIWNGLVQIVRDFVKSFIPLFVIFIGVWEISQGRLSVGGLVAFLGLVDAAYLPVDEIIYFKVKKANVNTLFNRNAELNTYESPSSTGYVFKDHQADNRIRILNLTKKHGEELLFENLNFEHTGNGLILIHGPNGKGKTTLLNLIKNMDRADEGSIEVQARSGMAYLPQEAQMFNLSVRENIYFDKKSAIEVPSFTEIHTVENPDKDYYRNERLSGGEKQKVGLSRIFVQDRGIWLLDEPEKNLDRQTFQSLYNALSLQKKQRLIVMVTHQPELQKIADRIVRIGD
ncbi:ABC transporter ATP-binding protein [Saccharibacillus sp. CPCC 101409]|uniref:ABC transporter transmembrane domain-containing protein n=1 Tax=Saccharibacillus sp. CPCC 101409 TaxID=3058041 RepID=UPI0026734B41|nr:ABC transporter ATP-binding protein [Saccharibacillus sp. CPCC 101409]MDO3410431.1 ABC transporter ATP-binding protein [Saccharibacillus sp. CPCC 101409]